MHTSMKNTKYCVRVLKYNQMVPSCTYNSITAFFIHSQWDCLLMILVIQLLHFISFPVDRHFVFFLALKWAARLQWTSLYGSLPWPVVLLSVVSLSADSLCLCSLMVQKLLDGKFQKCTIYISFRLLATMMKPLTVLLCPSQDVSHPFVQCFSLISHFVDILVVSQVLRCLSASVQVTLTGPMCKRSVPAACGPATLPLPLQHWGLLIWSRSDPLPSSAWYQLTVLSTSTQSRKAWGNHLH